MALFKQKKSNKASDDNAALFDDELREELRQSAREYFQKIIDDNAAHFKQDLDITVAQVGEELKAYMTKQLDGTVSHINEQISKQLNHRMHEYDRVTQDAHDLAVQSLNRSAHALHEQYEQFNSALQKSIASQEAMMVAAFNDNKNQIAETKKAQDQALQSLERSVEVADKQSKRLTESYEKSISGQEKMLTDTFEESRARIEATKQAQESALDTLNQAAERLQQQYEQLDETLTKAVSDHKAALVGAFENNMAQIIEHYLLNAIGEQYDMRAQLPLIIKQMEQNKQTIVDDMKL